MGGRTRNPVGNVNLRDRVRAAYPSKASRPKSLLAVVNLKGLNIMLVKKRKKPFLTLCLRKIREHIDLKVTKHTVKHSSSSVVPNVGE